MSDPGFASLGPSLLARKGGAKPAMRPQLVPLVQDEQELANLGDDQLEDLGWNDMGHDEDPDPEFVGGADIVPINADVSADQMAGGPGPIVRRQQRRLEKRVLADAAMTGPDDRESHYDAEVDDEVEEIYSAHHADEGEGEEYEGEDYANEESFAPLAPQPVPAPRKTPALAAPTTLRTPRLPAAKVGRRAAFTLRLDADRHLKLRLAATMQGVSAQTLVTEALDALLAEFDDLDVIANHLKRH